MSDETLLKEIITGYRHTIRDRYQYQNISNYLTLPPTINENAVGRIRDYFLDFIYPEFDKRQELNEAFESLDTFIKNPEKLLNILMTSVKLIFSHGRHLPKILNTGLKALRSFRAGTKFENKLVYHAHKNEIIGPFDTKKIHFLISRLSKHEIEEFIDNSQSLIEVFYDQKLVSQIKEILEYLISKMEKNQNLYTANDIHGMKIGYEMLLQGDMLFRSFDEKDQDYIVKMIITFEKNIMRGIFKED